MRQRKSSDRISIGANRGFTLVEAMIVMTVLAILMAVGIPAMSNIINDNRASTATNEFIAAINLARSEAIKRGRLVTICRSANAESGSVSCDTGGSDWGLGWLVYVEGSSADTAATESTPATFVGSYDVGEEVLLRHGAFHGKVKATGSTAQRITFNGTGEPVGMAGFSINFNYDDQYRRQLCMARTGRIKVIRDAGSC